MAQFSEEDRKNFTALVVGTVVGLLLVTVMKLLSISKNAVCWTC